MVTVGTKFAPYSFIKGDLNVGDYVKIRSFVFRVGYYTLEPVNNESMQTFNDQVNIIISQVLGDNFSWNQRVVLFKGLYGYAPKNASVWPSWSYGDMAAATRAIKFFWGIAKPNDSCIEKGIQKIMNTSKIKMLRMDKIDIIQKMIDDDAFGCSTEAVTKVLSLIFDHEFTVNDTEFESPF